MEHQGSIPVPPARDLQLSVQPQDIASCLDVMCQASCLSSCQGPYLSDGCHALEKDLQHAGTKWGQRPPLPDLPTSIESPMPGNGPPSVPPTRHLHHRECCLWDKLCMESADHDTAAGCARLSAHETVCTGLHAAENFNGCPAGWSHGR